MRKITAVSLTVLLIICALFSASFFIKTAITEYTLHEASDVLNRLTASSQLPPRRQQQELLTTAINNIEETPTTAVNAARSYQLQAKLYHLLSKLEVWPRKRKQYLQQAVYHNYNAINISHYDLQYWLFELQLQSLIDDDRSELFWSLSNVLTLGKWNYEVLSYAGFYCVLEWKKIPKTLRQPCSDAIRNVWENETQKRKMLSQLKGIYRFEDTVEDILR